MSGCGPAERDASPGSSPPATQRAATSAAESTGTRVVLLGTGTPDPDPDCAGPATAVVSGGRAFVVDLGPGVVRRAAAARRAGIEELDPSRIGQVFVTHLHSDHTAGYADLILTPAMRRRTPLRVQGPPGLREMTRHLVAAYEHDRAIRARAPAAGDMTGFQVIAEEISEPGIVFEDATMRVRAFAVPHGEWKHAFGYRFDAPDRSIVISGDTAASRAVVDACDGCDVLVHEVYRPPEPDRMPQAFLDYHAAHHTSLADLAQLAREARPKLLVLTHQMLFGATEAAVMEELRRLYDGPVAFGHDLDVY